MPSRRNKVEQVACFGFSSSKSEVLFCEVVFDILSGGNREAYMQDYGCRLYMRKRDAVAAKHCADPVRIGRVFQFYALKGLK